MKNLSFNIGFDAKRAFMNSSGLGNYSRNTLHYLSENFPGTQKFLYTPRSENTLFKIDPCKFVIKKPGGFFSRKLDSIWRSYGITHQAEKDGVRVYHGLSNELPFNIHKSTIKSVVTIHDLIFLRYPQFYRVFDRNMYRKKFLFACQHSDFIIAVSKQTADDIIRFFSVDARKIKVIYQTCNPVFQNKANAAEKNIVLEKYKLPKQFILNVGTIEKRKNLLGIVKALNEGKIEIPLVVIGKATDYLTEVMDYIEKNKLGNRIFIRSGVLNDDMPAIYQSAEMLVYPSLFEGFGIPIIEALFSGIPVVTSKDGCFGEAGGNGAIYVDPLNIHEISDAIKNILSDTMLRRELTVAGQIHLQHFDGNYMAQQLAGLYEAII